MHLGNVLDHLSCVIFTVDVDFNITSVNKVIEERGFKPEELKGINLKDYYVPKEFKKLVRARKLFFQNPEKYGNQIIRLKVLTKNGEMRDIECNVNALTKNDKLIGFCGISTDITEKLQQQKMLDDYKALKQQKEITGAIQHEMSQFIQIVVGNNDLLLMDHPEDDRLKKIKKALISTMDLFHKMRNADEYKTKPYLKGVNIVDIN